MPLVCLCSKVHQINSEILHSFSAPQIAAQLESDFINLRLATRANENNNLLSLPHPPLRFGRSSAPNQIRTELQQSIPKPDRVPGQLLSPRTIVLAHEIPAGGD